MTLIKTLVAGALVAASLTLSLATPASAEVVVIRHGHDWHHHDWHPHGWHRDWHRHGWHR